jgi:hypothetical protein
LTKDGKKDFVFVWEAGPAWWASESKLEEMKAEYALGDDSRREREKVVDPLFLAHPEPLEESQDGIDPTAHARLLHAVLELSGRRKDHDVWEKWWKRAIAAVPHARIWLRIGEVKERKARGECINMGSYLAKLVKIEAKRLGLSWAEERHSG